MKALLISAIVFFSLRAMAGEVGEDKKGECIFSDQSAKREAKIVLEPSQEKEKKEAPATISK
jgi:hypothetical protein